MISHYYIPTYNVKKTVHLITDLQNIDIIKNTKVYLFDITNMQTNIPTQVTNIK